MVKPNCGIRQAPDYIGTHSESLRRMEPYIDERPSYILQDTH